MRRHRQGNEQVALAHDLYFKLLLTAMACSGGVFDVGQAFEQCVHPGPGCREPGFERVTLLGQRLDLFGQQRVGALQLLVANEQPLRALGDLLNLDGAGPYSSGIVGFVTESTLKCARVGARGVVGMPQFSREAGGRGRTARLTRALPPQR